MAMTGMAVVTFIDRDLSWHGMLLIVFSVCTDVCHEVHHALCVQISAPVQACTMSEDCRHLLAAIGNGYIFRYEYRKPTSQDSGAEGDGPVVENGSK